MKAVNLVPADARRGRTSAGQGPGVNLGAFGPAQFLVVLLLIVVALVLLRVLADNTVNNKKATLAALQQQVVAEQAEASRLTVYVNFVQTIQASEQQVKEIAEQRFAWKRALDQISHVLPASTSLKSLDASTSSAASSTVTPGSTTPAAVGPIFTIQGCADTPNQNGVATLLRRLRQVTDVTDVGFQSSTRAAACGNSFNVTLMFAAPGADSSGASTSAEPSTSATATTPAATTSTTTSTGATG
jgi:Tfp pilus assembly protein PilN